MALAVILATAAAALIWSTDAHRSTHDHSSPVVVDGDADGMRPIPESMYGGRCPFQDGLFQNLPPGFRTWEDNLLQDYHASWEEAGSPTGVRQNDHNFNTFLGQGNTLAFVAAQLQIHDVPEALKHGLFAEPGVHPAVVRFSDFGDDDSTHKLARMAVKAYVASAWAEEVNLLFTETLDSFFGITDFESLSNFAGDASLPWYSRAMEGARSAADVVRVLLVRNFGEVVTGRMFTREALAKDYYGQLPYMLGEHQAMKFALIPLQETCGEDGADATCCLPPTSQPENASASAKWASGRARVTAAYLAECDAVFDLQLRVKEINAGSEETIMKRASARWEEEPVTVGRLTIPQQACSADYAVGLELQQGLASALGAQENDGLDKMFAFHPILTHEANRPVGEVNTFRSAFYSQHTAERFSTIHDGVMPAMLDTDGGSRPLPAKVPFRSLVELLPSWA